MNALMEKQEKRTHLEGLDWVLEMRCDGQEEKKK